MNSKININDRVIVTNSELNPLTNFYVIKELENAYRCRFSYGFIAGTSDISKYKVSKHPIQTSEFTFIMWIDGQEIPELNDFSKDLEKLKHWALAYRIPFFCLKEILDKIKYPEFVRKIREVLDQAFLNRESTTDELDMWIKGSVEQLPHDYKCQCIIEYSGEVVPVTAVFNSDHINDYFSASIFFLCFTVEFLKMGLVTEESILDIVDDRLSQFQ